MEDDDSKDQEYDETRAQVTKAATTRKYLGRIAPSPSGHLHSKSFYECILSTLSKHYILHLSST